MGLWNNYDPSKVLWINYDPSMGLWSIKLESVQSGEIRGEFFYFYTLYTLFPGIFG